MANSPEIQPGEIYERREDMSPEGRLQVLIQADGDVIITAMSPDLDGRLTTASVEFCAPGAGGGRSPKTKAALIELARAILEDNGGIPSQIRAEKSKS